MTRRRYLSTDVSRDARVARLAKEAGEFAALLYTWGIPHALDDATLPTSDPEELLLLIAPGFRWKAPEDVQAAVEAMVGLGLLERAGDRLRYPPEAFYKHQSYIREDRRGSAQGRPEPDPTPQTSAPPREPTPDSAESRPAAHISAKQRTSPQNAASSSFSSSFPVSSSSSVSPPTGGAAEPPPAPPRDEGGGNRFTAFMDELKRLDPDGTVVVGGTRDRNAGIVKQAQCDPRLLARALVALRRGQWEDPHVEARGNLQAIVDNIGGFLAAERGGGIRRGPPTAARSPAGGRGAPRHRFEEPDDDDTAALRSLGRTG